MFLTILFSKFGAFNDNFFINLLNFLQKQAIDNSRDGIISQYREENGFMDEYGKVKADKKEHKKNNKRDTSAIS